VVRILIVDSDKELVTSFKDALEFEGYEVLVAFEEEDALISVSKEVYDFLLVDLYSEKLNGVEVLKQARKVNKHVPIMIISHKSGAEEKVFGLNLGADDYMVKPISIPELTARIRAHLRKANIYKTIYSKKDIPAEGYEPVIIKVGKAIIHLDKMIVEREGNEVSLTPKEIGIIRLLYKNRGKVVSRETMMREIWGGRTYVTERVIDTNVVSIREKIGDTGRKSKYIKTVFGVGYKMVEL